MAYMLSVFNKFVAGDVLLNEEVKIKDVLLVSDEEDATVFSHKDDAQIYVGYIEEFFKTDESSVKCKIVCTSDCDKYDALRWALAEAVSQAMDEEDAVMRDRLRQFQVVLQELLDEV